MVLDTGMLVAIGGFALGADTSRAYDAVDCRVGTRRLAMHAVGLLRTNDFLWLRLTLRCLRGCHFYQKAEEQEG